MALDKDSFTTLASVVAWPADDASTATVVARGTLEEDFW